MYTPIFFLECSPGHWAQLISFGFNQKQGKNAHGGFHPEEKNLRLTMGTNNGGQCNHSGLMGCPICCPSNVQAPQFDKVA